MLNPPPLFGVLRRVILKSFDLRAGQTILRREIADWHGKVEAISRAHLMIEFDLDGTVLTANENFLTAMGYRLDEIRGKHHKIFVDADYARSANYESFWNRLNQGDYFSAEFKRLGKAGRHVWIQASYNPILGPHGEVMKVVKFATDVTPRVEAVTLLGEAISKLARGNLEQQLESPFIPSLDKLRLDFNETVKMLQTTVGQVLEGTASIAAGTKEIRGASDELSQRTERQAANLEETSTALREIKRGMEDAFEGTTQARQIVEAARADGERSKDVVSRAVQSIHEVAKSSRRMDEVVNLIDKIAAQTNLLALNAGIEAARSGDAGRGFAVIALEVRELAQRSAKAAHEVKVLIETSRAQIVSGVDLADEAGDAITRIAGDVAKIDAIVEGIAIASLEQSTAIKQVAVAVQRMDEMTQQNAAMAEEATAATHSLADEAAMLGRLVNQFRVGSDRAKEARSTSRAA